MNAENVQVKSKRGRKKKWESSNLKNFTLNNCTNLESSTGTISEESTNFEFKFKKESNCSDLNFGNLTIKVQEKEEKKPTVINFLTKEKKTRCTIELSDEEDETELKIVKKTVKHVNTNISTNNLKCYYCHHFFDNKAFYIPLKYSEELRRYKLFGNFCSPNCAKSYCLSSKLLENKTYLLCQFYRKLFGADFKITPAPSFLRLKDYGGDLTIEEFRKFSYTNNIYTLNNVACEMIFLK